jgi:hypothetical protein
LLENAIEDGVAFHGAIALRNSSNVRHFAIAASVSSASFRIGPIAYNGPSTTQEVPMVSDEIGLKLQDLATTGQPLTLEEQGPLSLN